MYSQCYILDCSLPAVYISKRLCRVHYLRGYRTGNPLGAVSPTEETRFWSKVERTESCWLWTAGQDGKGYGQFHRGFPLRTVIRAHRYAFLMSGKTIPEGLELDHLCRNRRCVNPDHLEAVTIATNNLRGESIQAVNARKTHCLRGHPFTEANTRINKAGARVCIVCSKSRRTRERSN